jgi:polar amino acid transport system substrate-binding protein
VLNQIILKGLLNMFSMCRVAGRSQARIAVLLSGALLASACSQRPTITATDQLGGKEFAVPTGSVADALVKSKFPDARFKYFNTVLDAAMAVKTGKADAAAYDEPILRNIAGKNPGLAVLAAPITVDEYGFAVRLGDDALKDAIDGVVSEARADGLYQQMMDRWLPKQGSPGRMPELAAPDTSAGVLRFGTASVTEPFSFVDGSQQVVGFDVEIAARVAARLNKRLEIVNMDFGALIPALIADKVDMIGACITITDERKKSVLFSESYYTGGISALVRQ